MSQSNLYNLLDDFKNVLDGVKHHLVIFSFASEIRLSS